LSQYRFFVSCALVGPAVPDVLTAADVPAVSAVPTAVDAFLLLVLPTYLTSLLLLVVLLVVSAFVGYLL
jgi:hypothetical protein